MKKREKQVRKKTVIGWNEFVALPEWDIPKIKAKIDTGARSSALHVEQIEQLPNNHLSFWVVLDKHKERKIKVVARVKRHGHVKSSHGETSGRFFVETKIRIGPVTRKIELNLVDRGKMNFRMLLGRTALRGRFMIDVAYAGLLSQKKQKKRRWNENRDFI